MEISPTFWVGFSFFVFVILAWNVIRKSFLSIIHNYKTSIASNLSEIYSKKFESEEILEKSTKELAESNSNSYILNAHKVAKTIIDSSKERIHHIKTNVNKDLKASASGLELFLQKKAKNYIIDISSRVIEEYIYNHKEEFNKIAVQKAKEMF
jgi:F0F1-type ATP synthase membrane subunit b/b'